jgi:hypothetical protein
MASAGSVTLPGAGGGTATIQAGSGDHVFVAQIIANTILLAQDANNLNPAVTVSINGGVATTTPPALVNGEQNILYLVGSGGGTYNIPAGYNYVVDLLTGPETITGSDVQVIAYDSSGSATKDSFVLTGNSSIAADPNANYNITITGAFNEATGDGNNTVTAIGNGTIAGGTGTNVFNVTPTVPGSGIRVQSSGVGDKVTVTDPSGGTATVLSSADDFTLGSIGLVTIEAALQGDDDTVTGGSADTRVTASGSHNIVLGGSPGGALTYVSNGTGDTIAAFGASTANVSLNGSGSGVGTGDLLIGGSGILNADLSGAFETIGGGSSGSATNVTINSIGFPTDELILGGAGSLSVLDNGQNDTIAPFGSSSSTVTLGGSHNLLFAGSNSMTVTVNGTNDTVAGGSAPMTITASSAATVFENAGALSFIGGAGASSIVGAAGTPTAITVGAGGVTFWTGGNDTSSIFGGAGVSTLLGASGSVMYFSDPTSTDGGLNFSAGTGNETLDAAGSTTKDFYGSGSNSISGSTTVFANDSIVGGSGDDTFTAGAGSDTFSSGAGDNQFVFFASQTDGQHDYITNWTSNDSLFLLNYSNSDSANTLMANSTSDNGALTITLSDNTEITFTTVAAGDTSAFNGKILYS